MATSLTARLAIPADPAAAFGLLIDPDFVREVAEATGGSDVEVTVTPADDGGATVVSRRTLPADVPSYAKALVGGKIEKLVAEQIQAALTREQTVAAEHAA